MMTPNVCAAREFLRSARQKIGEERYAQLIAAIRDWGCGRYAITRSPSKKKLLD